MVRALVDKKLLAFPVLSGLCIMIVTTPAILGMIVAVVAMSEKTPAGAPGDDSRAHLPIWAWPILFVVYFLCYFIAAFFQSALFSCAMVKFEGGQPSIRAGMKVAASRTPQLIAWALLNATVGIALQMLQEKLGWLGRLIVGTINIGWNIATFFVVPVLVFEGVGPITAIKRSTEVIRKSWGESLVTQFGFSFVSGLIGLAIAVVCIGLGVGSSMLTNSVIPGVFFGVLLLASLILLGIIGSAMKSLLIAATYRYTTTGIAAGPFHTETLQAIFKPKKSKE